MSVIYSLSSQPHHPKPRLKAGLRRNVRVAIGEMKLPTATPGVPPFKVDEKASIESNSFRETERQMSTAKERKWVPNNNPVEEGGRYEDE